MIFKIKFLLPNDVGQFVLFEMLITWIYGGKEQFIQLQRLKTDINVSSIIYK